MKISLKKLSLIPIFIVTLLLTGCMYPTDEKVKLETPYPEQLDSIQKAVNSYQKSTNGLLPIKTRDLSTDIYIKYPIEFSKIVPAYIEKIPVNAYENGGIYQYVLTEVEENPTVKLVDLRVAERIRELNLRKNINGYVPFKESVGKNVFAIDYKKMGYEKAVTVPSPYSDAHLPLIVGGDGKFYIDYSLELNRLLKEMKPKVKKGEDIRFLLADNYPVLPAYSLPYTVNNQNEPVFMDKSK
ncbi:hypothetical protein FITA111629_00910 [Filibacter tadaridae]|uniref:Lipoprotein n=2 Tax=Filibacter tadaridae TaxID=2483811 RepID=A0A3P5XKJ1_9BACL|nr:hypothetical protein [Filibacter tadaridae]VDC29254.1 hypothetical protein FILTAD_02030 [Filibacter tadaridae]